MNTEAVSALLYMTAVVAFIVIVLMSSTTYTLRIFLKGRKSGGRQVDDIYDERYAVPIPMEGIAARPRIVVGNAYGNDEDPYETLDVMPLKEPGKSATPSPPLLPERPPPLIEVAEEEVEGTSKNQEEDKKSSTKLEEEPKDVSYEEKEENTKL